MFDKRWLQCRPIVLISLVFMVLALTGSGRSQVQDETSLDNGLVRLSFNQKTGFFDLHSSSTPSLRLYGAGPRFELNGKSISLTMPTKSLSVNNNCLAPTDHGRSQGQQRDVAFLGLFKTH